jgi:hydrogenase-4 component B
MLNSQYLFELSIGLYILGAILAVLLNRRERTCSILSYGCSAIASISGIAYALSVIISGPQKLLLPVLIQITDLSLYIDGLSAFFIFVISLSGFAVSIYSIGYSREYFGRKSIGFLCFLYNVFILSMLLVVSANNAILFLVVWEIMSLVSYFLVTYEHENKESRRAGYIYILMTHAGTGFIILSFLVFAGAGGSFSFDAFRTSGSMLPSLRDAAFLLALIGFGTKAGIVPLHIWLPYAHPSAPSNVSALMSGVMIKTAIYGLIRVTFDFLGGDVLWWGLLILIIASICALLGVMYALMEHDLKRLLAFHSVENIGIILMGIGISMILMSAGMPKLAAFALIAGLYHLINHAMFKALLFMGAGSIIFSTHTKNIEEMGGLIKKMPWTSLFFLIGSISISGLPPFNGFVSEWLTFQSQLLSLNLTDNIIKITVLFSGAALALTCALAAACFVKAFGISFLALPRSAHSRNAKEVQFSMLAGMGILSLLCLLLGIFPVYVLPFLDKVTGPLVGASIMKDVVFNHSLATFNIAAGSISTIWIILLLFIFLPLIFIFAFFVGGRAQTRKYETWGCGQPVITSRNEYTATAFSKPIRIWFGNIYRPHREIQTTYAGSPYFKESLIFNSEIEPIFEKYLYAPIVWLVITISRILKVIQTGSIQLYLLYILITLVIALIYVGSGG